MRENKYKKVMVTGAAGFIGSHLVEKLLNKGYRVNALDIVELSKSNNLKNVSKHKNLNYYCGDIRDKKIIEDFFIDDADMIYHLASVVGVRHYMEDPLYLIDCIITGTKNILELCMKTNTKIIFASTSEIYGKNENIPWGEDADRVLGNPSIDRWSYSSSKALIEHMLFGLYHKKKIKFSTVRFFNVYGPRQSPIYVVSQTIYRILRNESPDLYDGGSQNRCFTYIDDAVNGLITVATHNKALGEAFNIGNQTPTKIIDVLKTCLELTKSEIKVNKIDTKIKYGSTYQDIVYRIPDSSKAKILLGWSAKTQLKDGIANTIDWIGDNSWYLK